MADSFAASIGSPRNLGEGLTALGKGWAVRNLNRRAEESENAGLERATKEASRAREVIMAAIAGRSPRPHSAGTGPMTINGIPPLSEEQEIGDDAMAAIGKPEAMSTQGFFGSLEQQHGLPEGYLARTAQIESGGDPNAQNPNSSAGGMFQFIDSTAKQYGLTDKTDPQASARAAAQLAADNAAHLRQALGREPTAAELYLAHQQGAGGAAKLLSNPNASAAGVVGNDAVSLNGGNVHMTAGEFANQWTGKFGGGTPQANPQVDYSAVYEALANPWLDQGQRSALMGMLQEARQANDPFRQMQLQKGQLELEQMRNPQEEKTALMRNFEAAIDGGYQGDFVQYQTDIKKAGATQNTITVGGADAPVPGYPKAPNGFMYVRDPATGQVVLNEQGIAKMAPIIGGPEDTSQADAQAAQVAAQTEATRSSVVVDTVNEIRETLEKDGLFDLPEVGVIGSKLRHINQESADMAGMLETLKGMVVFDRLEQLKRASATGASGLGQVTEKEIDLLGAQLGALKQDMSKERIEATLDTIEGVFGKLSPEAEAYLTGRSEALPSGSAQTGAVATNAQPVADFSTMEINDLINVDVDSLPPAQQDALSRRFQELGY
ncbi:transglycosylase SLT domain-containing protein [Ruegeria sp. EL01]|uniref:transglycosylase SLT domain-containing protein n=1 Tax=Ruegeria sp. EL01 TaxID=2107578 RepID=UPI001C1FC5D5|nr:transglycosylase SLT domain-containing protein [Ruegeria sp. EL01]